MDINNPAHNEQIEVELSIVSIGTKLTKHDLLPISVIPKAPYTKDVILVSPEDLSRMARNVGSIDNFTLADAVNGTGDLSKLSMTMTYKEAGQPIGTDENGDPIISNTGHTTFQKSFWETSDLEVIPSVDAQDSINELNQKVNLEYALKHREQANLDNKRAKERRSRKSVKKAVETLDVQTNAQTNADTVDNTPPV